MQAILPPPDGSMTTEVQLRTASIQAKSIEGVSYITATSKVKHGSQWFSPFIYSLFFYLQSQYYNLMSEKIYELLKKWIQKFEKQNE